MFRPALRVDRQTSISPGLVYHRIECVLSAKYYSSMGINLYQKIRLGLIQGSKGEYLRFLDSIFKPAFVYVVNCPSLSALSVFCRRYNSRNTNLIVLVRKQLKLDNAETLGTRWAKIDTSAIQKK